MEAEKKKFKVKLKAAPPSSEENDLDLRLAKAWNSFRNKVADFVSHVEECTVELHFESSLDPRTHHTFDPDEAVFISDVKISANNQVIFTVPHGSKEKSFFFSEAELIHATLDGEKAPLNSILGKLYSEAFAEVPEAPTITMLERKYLATNVELRELLNNVEFFLKDRELKKARAGCYSTLDTFGLF
jgi:hypothetical protein